MEYEEIKKLMDDMGNSKLSSLDIEFPDGIKISMAKTVQKDISVVTAERITPTVVEIDSTKDKKQKEESLETITSPMVGTFYASDAPDKPAYVKVGDKIHKGQVVCIVEAMKLMNEIESEFDGEIYEIYVVVGYLKEQFVTLEKEYPGVKLIENPYYDTCNNIASLYVARDYIENAIILDGDQIIYNPEILAPEFERSGYNSVWTDGETDEWLQNVENGIVTACSRTGGKGGWQLYSISRWTAEDGKKLKRHLEIEFEQKKNQQIYWDDVAMFCYPKEYQLGIRPMNRDDITEVDNLSELIALDASYKKYVEEK